MKVEINRRNFDVLLVGAGAYGLPLAAHSKSQGAQAVVVGGATHILFGIKGRRWDEHPEISTLYNEHWTRPLKSETPENFSAVEDGCYW